MLFDYEQELTIHRKDATQKTAATNADTYKNIDWEQVKSEKILPITKLLYAYLFL